MSDPAAPPTNTPDADDDDGDATPRPAGGFDFARVLRIAVVVVGVMSGFAAAHGLLMTLQHYVKEIPAGTITHVEAVKGGQEIVIAGRGVAVFPRDILNTTGRPIELRPSMQVAKRVGTLTYEVAGQSRGGLLWALRQWLLPARVTLPLVIYFVLSWLLVFRANEHRRHIAVELFVIPLVRWIVIMLVSLITFAVLAGCALSCAGLLRRMAG